MLHSAKFHSIATLAELRDAKKLDLINVHLTENAEIYFIIRCQETVAALQVYRRAGPQ